MGDSDSVVSIESQRIFYKKAELLYEDKQKIKFIEYPNLNHFVTTNMMEECISWFYRYLWWIDKYGNIVTWHQHTNILQIKRVDTQGHPYFAFLAATTSTSSPKIFSIINWPLLMGAVTSVEFKSSYIHLPYPWEQLLWF